MAEPPSGKSEEERNLNDDESFTRNVTRRERDGFLKMVTMGMFANLYNCSPGRDPVTTAKIAVQAAEALWEAWVKRGDELARGRK